MSIIFQDDFSSFNTWDYTQSGLWSFTTSGWVLLVWSYWSNNWTWNWPILTRNETHYWDFRVTTNINWNNANSSALWRILFRVTLSNSDVYEIVLSDVNASIIRYRYYISKNWTAIYDTWNIDASYSVTWEEWKIEKVWDNIEISIWWTVLATSTSTWDLSNVQMEINRFQTYNVIATQEFQDLLIEDINPAPTKERWNWLIFSGNKTPKTIKEFIFQQDWQQDLVSWNTATLSWAALSTDNLWNTNKAIVTNDTAYADFWTPLVVNPNTWITVSYWIYNTQSFTWASEYLNVFWTWSVYDTNWSFRSHIYDRASVAWPPSTVCIHNIWWTDYIIWYHTFSSIADMNTKIPTNTWTNFIFTTDWVNNFVYRNWSLLSYSNSYLHPLTDSTTPDNVRIWNWTSTEKWFNWRTAQFNIWGEYVNSTRASELYSIMSTRYLTSNDL